MSDNGNIYKQVENQMSSPVDKIVTIKGTFEPKTTDFIRGVFVALSVDNSMEEIQ